MCGLAGEFMLGGKRADLARVIKMATTLRHRGPDDQGHYLSPDARYAVALQRLAVIDPPASRQPMISPDGNTVIAFNGEIYNFRQLRSELVALGHNFTTSGDTEVVLHTYLQHGIDMLHKLDGMFAVAIYDARTSELLLARDRLGEKPLWYAKLPDRVVFASEAKAILNYPGIDKSICSDALIDYCSLGYVHAPLSIWNGIAKLPPGSFLRIAGTVPQPQRYWQPQIGPKIEDGLAVQQVRELLDQAVRARMISDVPLGALLSGGVDSAVVVALMSKIAGRTGGIKTFTAGFDEAVYDERSAARQVAEHCGTDHTELLIRPHPSIELVDQMVSMYDEPFADSSSIPTFLICQAAREHVTVALTGDGGDEVFAGYERYRALHLADKMTPPRFLMYKLAGAMAGLFAGHEERGKLRRLARFTKTLAQPSSEQYLSYRSLFEASDLQRLLSADFLSHADPASTSMWFTNLFEQQDFDDEVARAQWHDLMTYLPDDLLVKSDIASMASSLELRAPMLAHYLVPLGLSLPVNMKIRAGRGKYILKAAFSDMLPKTVFGRPKRGFGVPLGSWLRKELAGTLQETLLDRSFLDRGLFEPNSVRGLVNDHILGRDDHRHRLWALLVLARWLQKSGI